MAYYECLSNNDHINIGDNFTVNLTGSHNQITTATVCYINKSMVCLLGDVSLGNGDWSTQRGYSWNYTVNINGKEYTGVCKIPTLEQIYSKCAGYKRDFNYWTSTSYDSRGSWCVYSGGHVYGYGFGNSLSTLPFIEIAL